MEKEFEKLIQEKQTELENLKGEIEELRFQKEFEKRTREEIFKTLDVNVLKDVKIFEVITYSPSKCLGVYFKLNNEDISLNVSLPISFSFNSSPITISTEVVRKVAEKITETVFKVLTEQKNHGKLQNHFR